MNLEAAVVHHVWSYPARVVRVIDGDTVICAVSLGFELMTELPVRLAGVDCPERDAVAGQTAKAFTEFRMPVGSTCTLLYQGREKYGRALGRLLYLDPLGQERDLTDDLIAAGHVKARTALAQAEPEDVAALVRAAREMCRVVGALTGGLGGVVTGPLERALEPFGGPGTEGEEVAP